MKKNLVLLICTLILFPCLSLWAADVGLILDTTAGYSGSQGDIVSEKDGAFDYSGSLIPWFSDFSGNNGGIYFSASARADWKNKELTWIPELLRTEVSWRSDSGEFKLGRMQYADPLGFIANGLFDGAYISMDMGGGSVSLGAWYTGLLYKERANITMTQTELELYNTALDYENFTDTYFAPRRVISALGWEHQGLFERAQVQFTLLGQFDLAKENGLYSQYAVGKLSLPISFLVFDLGGCLEAIEFLEEYRFAAAGEFGVAWMFPAARLSVLGRYSGGVPEDEESKMTAFLPLSTVYQGEILKARLSGISVASLDYLGRFHQTLSAGVTASCFMRSDLATYSGYPVITGDDTGDDKYILGSELFGRVIWAPISEMQVSVGGGAFLPALGNVARNAPLLWRVEMNLIFALF
ncbi:MAG: hypothetical protein LBB89_04240 [Treponema sp.]|jgi:hypothetical protein|nr:hypothetical protein [Treponema sp.]